MQSEDAKQVIYELDICCTERVVKRGRRIEIICNTNIHIPS